MQGFHFQPQSELGVASTLNIVRNKQKRIIGYVDQSKLNAFKRGNTEHFVPVHHWRKTFSVSLMKRLGLDPKR